MVRHVLFVCSANRLRSPTAEQIFAGWPGIEVDSAGLNHDADQPVSAELAAWADLVMVMEQAQRRRLMTRFRRHLGRARIVCLGIPDDYGFMDQRLVDLLRARVTPHLPPGAGIQGR